MPKINELPVNYDIPDRARELEDECRIRIHNDPDDDGEKLIVYRFMFEKIAELQIALEERG